jgi:hypothetical protein
MGPRIEAWKGAHLSGTYVCKKALEMSISFYMGPVGEHGVSVYQEIWESIGGLWKWIISVYGSSVRETWRGLLYCGS